MNEELEQSLNNQDLEESLNEIDEDDEVIESESIESPEEEPVLDSGIVFGDIRAPEISLGRTKVPEQTELEGGVIGATFRQFTDLGVYLNRQEEREWSAKELVESLNDFEDSIGFLSQVPERHRDNFSYFALDRTPDDFAWTSEFLDQKQNDEAIMAESPLLTLGSGLLLSPLSPENYLPYGAVWKAFKNASRLTRSTISAGSAGAFSSLVQESVFQELQPSRDFEESYANILASSIFSAAIGGGASILAPHTRKLATSVKEKAIDDISDVIMDRATKKYGDDVDPNSPIFNKFERMLMFQSARNRLARSDSPVATEIANNLFTSDFITIKNLSGEETRNVESLIQLDQGKMMSALVKIQNIMFKQAGVERGIGKYTRAKRNAEKAGNDSIYDGERFYNAMGEVIISNKPSKNPAVNEASELLRNELFEPVKERMIQVNKLRDGYTPNNADLYYTQIPSERKIKDNPDGYREFLIQEYTLHNNVIKKIRGTSEYGKFQSKVNSLEKQIKKQSKLENADEIKKLRKEIDEARKEIAIFAKDVATKNGIGKNGVNALFHTAGKFKGQLRAVRTSSKIKGDANNTFNNSINNRLPLQEFMVSEIDAKARPLNDRRFLIDQEKLIPWLNTNAMDVASIYIKQMVPVLRMEEYAQSLPFNNKRNYKSYKEYYETSIKRRMKEADEQKVGKNKDEQAAIDKQLKKDKQDIQDSFKLLLGVYGNLASADNSGGAKALKAFLSWNFIRLLGGVTLASIPDVGLHVFTHGLYSTVWDGIRPFIKQSIGTLEKFSKDDLQAIGSALNTQMGTRALIMANLEDVTMSSSLFGRTFDSLTAGFGNVTLANQWNDMGQNIAGTMSINRSLKTIENVLFKNPVDEADLVRMARLGVSRDSFKEVYDMWVESGKNQDGGTYFANWSNWNVNTKARAKAMEEFQAATLQEVNQVIIIPGLGDKPTFAHQWWGKLLLQFKSFLLASTNKVLLSGLQRKDQLSFYTGLATMAAMGDLSYIITQMTRGNQEIDLSFENLALEAFTRSGMFGIFASAYNTGAIFGLGFGGPASQYRSRGAVGGLLGPTAGGINDIAGAMNSTRKAFGGDQLSKKEVEQALRLLPYQNHAGSWLLSRKLIHGTALKSGIEKPERSKTTEDLLR